MKARIRMMRFAAFTALLVAAMSTADSAAAAAPVAAGAVSDGGRAGCETASNVADVAGAPLPQDCAVSRS